MGRSLTLVAIRAGAGRATVGSHTVVVEPCGPGWRVGAEGPVLSPISFAQRSSLLREAGLAGDGPADVARGIARAAGAGPGAADDPVVQSIALHLAGAGAGDLAFAEVWVAVVGHLGSDPVVVAAMTAADADALAETVVERAEPESDGSWTTLLLGGGDDGTELERDADTLSADAVAVALATDLLDRARARPIRHQIRSRHVAEHDPRSDLAPTFAPFAAAPSSATVAPAAPADALGAANVPTGRWGDVASTPAAPPANPPAPRRLTSAAPSGTVASPARSAASSPPTGAPIRPSAVPWPSSSAASPPARPEHWGPRRAWRLDGAAWAPASDTTVDAVELDGPGPVAPGPAAGGLTPGPGRAAIDRWRDAPDAGTRGRAATSRATAAAGADGALAELAARLHRVADVRGVAR